MTFAYLYVYSASIINQRGFEMSDRKLNMNGFTFQGGIIVKASPAFKYQSLSIYFRQELFNQIRWLKNNHIILSAWQLSVQINSCQKWRTPKSHFVTSFFVLNSIQTTLLIWRQVNIPNWSLMIYKSRLVYIHIISRSLTYELFAFWSLVIISSHF